MKGGGFQEIVITRDHERSLGFMNNDEISLDVKTYIERYKALKKEKCVEYILIFHNNGPTAGASVGHPHSQIFALPIVPTDVSRSLAGSEKYFSKHKICVHCAVMKKKILLSYVLMRQRFHLKSGFSRNCTVRILRD